MRLGVNTLFMIPGEVGGSEIYLRQTLIAICDNFPHVHLVLFTNRENDNVLRKDLSACTHVDFALLGFKASNRYLRIIREQIELPIRSRRYGIDVLWSPGYTAPLFSHCSQVVNILDMQYKNHPDDLTFMARFSTHLLVSAAARQCDGIIALSEFSMSEIEKYTSAKKNKIEIVNGGVSQEFGESMPEAKRQKVLAALELNEWPYILTVGNTYPHKNSHVLIDAFHKIMNRIEHKLILVGQPHLGEKMVLKAVEAVPDKKRIIRLSGISRQQLIALYQGADIFVFPSLYEGFGLPILEAMMAGTPVVTTNMGSIPEVGSDKVIYAPTPDAQTIAACILDVFGWNRNRRSQWIKAAKEWAAIFTWEETAKKTIEFIKQFHQLN